MKSIKIASRIIILPILFLSCVAAIGISLRRSFAQTRSVQAFINGEITSVRASIPGELQLKSEKIKLSNKLKKGTRIGTITSTVENPRVSILIVEKQQLETSLEDIRQQLSGVKRQIQNRTKLMNLFQQQTVTQRTLQVNYADQEIKQYEEEIARARAEEKVALADAQRFDSLAKQGAVTISKADNQIARAQQASAQAKEAQAKIEQAKLRSEATKAGLQLEGTRTLSYPETRVFELDVELTDLKQQEKNLEEQIQSIQSRLSITSKELQVQRSDSIIAPTTGVIWSINSQPQEIVEANKPIIQLLNCQNLWIDAFINETDANKLVIGQKAEINLDRSTDVRWKGRVETIRAGVGRVEVGQYVVQPPPEIARRQLPTRVAAVRLKIDWQKTPKPGDFCFAGRNVDVRFIE
jgi:hypothetical protein